MAKKILNRITNNIGLKLISVVIAVVLWLVVVNIDNPQMTVTFTSSANIINENIIKDNGKVFEVVDNSDSIKFSVTGPRTIVEGMSASDFTVTADMNKIDLDLGLVPVEVTADRYASKVSISVKSTNVRVSIENVKSQQFAITSLSGRVHTHHVCQRLHLLARRRALLHQICHHILGGAAVERNIFHLVLCRIGLGILDGFRHNLHADDAAIRHALG